LTQNGPSSERIVTSGRNGTSPRACRHCSGKAVRWSSCAILLRTGTRNRLKLRSIGVRDCSVFEGGQRIGRIRFAGERLPPIWRWNVVVHLSGGLPMGQAGDLDTAKADLKVAWEACKANTSESFAETWTRVP
jgi:hypothetical protein